MLENYGIRILLLSYSSDAFNGLSVGEDDKGPASSIEHKRFSTAHELGHLLTHLSDYGGKARSEDKVQEKEADLFAEYFLMTEQGFNSEWEETAGMPFVLKSFDFYADRLSSRVP
ncbi:ImmA/IrrE family metallo-endopeptidase [Sediminispirochaeta smaragdinae]|uniref:ImmA/IrrE family metallo-endopeptidase n=1 Tax=Sediminispirochaeta smaragdinae TaxID=55206 RepID=UPI001494AC62|nr:ImmA/IrrE family metallo-endopeptidase [Sediminispirochaeta smaragdinae]